MPKPRRWPLRLHVPVRSRPAQSRSYRAYKAQLQQDFRKRCGYCDDSDTYVGGRAGSHIDHFAPKSRFPALENEYENLVYACPFCNRAKSNKWVGGDAAVPNDGTRGFVDPCGPELDGHLERSQHGAIVGTTPLGRYLVGNLDLRLARHQYIWQMGRMETLADELLRQSRRLPAKSDVRAELMEQIADLFEEYRGYSRALHEQ